VNLFSDYRNQNLQIPPNLLLYVNVDPLEALTVEPSPPKTAALEPGEPEEPDGCGPLVVFEPPVVEAFFGLITVK